MDDELRAAYDRLDDALTPPGDAAALVAGRVVLRRRRRRTTLAVAGAVSAVALITGVATTVGGSDTPAIGRPTPGPTSSATTTGPTPTPTIGPSSSPNPETLRPADLDELTCPGAERRIGTVANPEAYVGGPYGPETVRPWLLPEAGYAFYRIDEDEIVARLTTQKGEVYAVLGLIAMQHYWRVESVAACTSAFPGLDEARVFGSGLPLVAFVAVAEGHCWVDTLEYDGRSWDLRDEDQFGTGGLGPDGFLAVGSVELSAGDTRLTYLDLSGAHLTFVPADSPGTEANDGLCD